MENNKYYTPTIEEFHVGFEFEVQTLMEKEWIKAKFSIELYGADKLGEPLCHSIVSWLKNNIVRVKYLDKEDIESLGWVQNNRYENSKYWISYTLNGCYITIGISDTNINPYKITIDNGESYDLNDTYFNGIIKNKSELKKLMKQLGIND